ncbi:MAG: TraB/GumN family protein [Ignavibacteria bacterium]|nr:TraB/GumN family protein [Ignavibacteria bacterium]
MQSISLKITSLIFILLFLESFSFAKQINAEKKNFLWEIKSNTTKAYLLGSIHLGKETMYPLDTVIENRFNECDNLVVETNVKGTEALGLAASIDMMYGADSTVKDELSEFRYEKLKEIASYCSLPSILLNKVRLGYSLIFLQLKKLNDMGYAPNYGIDLHFLNKAEGKKVLELESAESQISLMNSLIEAADTSIIDLEYFKTGIETMDSLVYAWQNGDIEFLEELLSSESAVLSIGGDEMSFKLNDERNFQMLEIIEKYLESNEKYFIIVGAAHLVGENGLINLLREKNKYFIKQL